MKISPLAGIKNVATSIIILLSDSKDVFPRVASTAEMRRRSEMYLKNPRLWTSPDGRPVLYNTALGGLRVTALEDVSGTLLLWEERPSSSGMRAVAFADGHAKLANVAEWKKIWAAELERRKTRR